MFELHHQLGDASRQTYRCSATECVVGRGRGNDLTIASRFLARRHARFTLAPDGLFIDDLNSRQGCWVNGQRVSRYGPLSELDEITLGNVRVQVGLVSLMEAHDCSGERSSHSGTPEVSTRTGFDSLGNIRSDARGEAAQAGSGHLGACAGYRLAETDRVAAVDESARVDAGPVSKLNESAPVVAGRADTVGESACVGLEGVSTLGKSTCVDKSQVSTPGESTCVENSQASTSSESTCVDQSQVSTSGESTCVEKREASTSGESTQVESSENSESPGTGTRSDSALNTWSRVVHERLLNQMDLRRKDVSGMSDSQLREESAVLITHIVEQLVDELPVDLNVAILAERVLDEAIGLGPLEQFLSDDTVTEIMVNNHRDIFLERNGRIERSPQQFSSDRTIYAVIERIITPLGRRIDESSPIVDARLKDGSRVNAVIPPLALKGPCLTIRKFPKHRLNFTDLVSAGSVDKPMVDFLQVCVQHRKNIVVAGGTGSGKTTLLNVLSNFIPDTDRIVTIEDAAELRLVQPNLVSLESRPPNLEGRGAIPMRDLVRNALRMRPDRIVIGECRGGEAIDMLQAMNTGHDGSLTTVHANNPRDVISRLEVLVLMAGMDLPVAAIREQIASAVNLVIQQTRFPCGARKITRVTEVAGLESGTVQLQDIFVFRQEGFDSDGRVRGSFRATGSIPAFYESLSGIGHQLDLDCFEQRA